MKLEVIFDTTSFIQESVNEIGIELGLAVVLTALVCWVFLGSLSSTMNVLFAIPMSLLGTIAILYFAGFTLNTFTLLGLSLAVGLVVDDAVMVMENIFRHAEMGKDRVRAASRGHQGDHLRRARGDDRGHRDLHAGRLHERRSSASSSSSSASRCRSPSPSRTSRPSRSRRRAARRCCTTHVARGARGRRRALADRALRRRSRAGYARALERSLRAPWIVLGVGGRGARARRRSPRRASSRSSSRRRTRAASACA